MNTIRHILVAFQLPEPLHDIVAGISRFARQHQHPWQIVLCSTAHDFRAAFVRQFADGAITGLGSRAQHIIRRLKQSRTPIVNVIRDLYPSVPSVLSNNVQIGRVGADYFMQKGFRQFAFVGVDLPWSRTRQSGFTARLRDAGKPEPIQLNLRLKDFEFGSQMAATRALAQWAGSLPPHSAVMCSADFIARVFLNVCDAQGIQVPARLAVLGVDNLVSECQVGPVTLSSVAQNFERIGYEAASLLDRLMEKPKLIAPGPILIPPERIHVRTSTDVFAFEDPIIVDTLRIIHQRAATGLSMKELLAEIPLSRKWLDHRFKRIVGHTPSDEIRRCRMQTVSELLTDTEMPLRQIAARCRFSCVQNLIRCFRVARGISPNAFRQNARLGANNPPQVPKMTPNRPNR